MRLELRCFSAHSKCVWLGVFPHHFPVADSSLRLFSCLQRASWGFPLWSDARSFPRSPGLRVCSMLNGPFRGLAGAFRSPVTSDEDAFGCGWISNDLNRRNEYPSSSGLNHWYPEELVIFPLLSSLSCLHKSVFCKCQPNRFKPCKVCSFARTEVLGGFVR